MSASKVIDFLKSWGLDAEDDNASLSSSTYSKMIDEASKVGGKALCSFLASIVDATDGEFYINVTTWEEVTEAWENF